METRKIVGYKLTKDYPFRFNHTDANLGDIRLINNLTNWSTDEMYKFPEHWQPVYESVPVTEKDVDEILQTIEEYCEDNNGSFNTSFGSLLINKKNLIRHINTILNKKLLPILLSIISITGFSQPNVFQATPKYYSHQNKMNKLSFQYHRFENHKDASMGFLIVGGLMLPVVKAFAFAESHPGYSFERKFYGTYTFFVLGCGIGATYNEIKARKIRRKYLKLENQ